MLVARPHNTVAIEISEEYISREKYVAVPANPVIILSSVNELNMSAPLGVMSSSNSNSSLQGVMISELIAAVASESSLTRFDSLEGFGEE